MEKLLLIELKKKLNWKERLIISLFKKCTCKVIKISTKKVSNGMLL